MLHWQSVRPVPRVTIDFGDGRKLERTLTGNSAHYVLASDGTPLDVLPGLYSPLAFQQWAVGRCATLHVEVSKRRGRRSRGRCCRRFIETDAMSCCERWDFDIQRLGDGQAELVSTRINQRD